MLLIVNLTSTASAAPPISYQQTVVATLTNSVGDTVPLRRGYWLASSPSSGFGWDKVYHKHRITNIGVIRYIVRNPDKVTP